MRITTVICAIAVLAALMFFLYTFMIEGFRMTMEEARATGFMKANSDTICSAFGNGDTGDCYKCLDPDGINHPGTECGYWPQGNACIPRSGIYRLVPVWLTQRQNTDKSYPQTFDPTDFVYNVGKCGGAACASFTSCKTCAGAAACGWCDTTNTCMDRVAVAKNLDAIAAAGSLGSMGSPPQPMCPAKGSSGEAAITSAGMTSSDSSKNALVQEIGKCRPEVCEDKKNCFDCASTSGCGFCRTTGKCIKVDTAGNAASSGSISGSSLCATGQISLQPYMCPCSGIGDCKTCSTQPGCGWCVAGKNCVNVEQRSPAGDSQNVVGGVNIKDCAAGGAGVATSASQCVPGAKLGNVRSERTSKYKPGAAELNLIQDNTALSDSGRDLNLTGSIGTGVIGAAPVSAAKTTKEVTGNAVVVQPPGATGGPYRITNQPNLFTSPFEEYVKVLIRSELTAGGVPINEPFQDAPPNAVKYLTKEVSKVIRKNF